MNSNNNRIRLVRLFEEHIYINRCGFHAFEFFNEHHPDPNMPEQFDKEDGLFKFEKRMI